MDGEAADFLDEAGGVRNYVAGETCQGTQKI